MKFPLKVSFLHMSRSAALAQRIQDLAQRLERFSANITKCQVTVSLPHKHKGQGNLFAIRVDLDVPGAAFSILHTHRNHHRHEDPGIALKDAFQAARRKLQDYERKRRLDVKAHSLAS